MLNSFIIMVSSILVKLSDFLVPLCSGSLKFRLKVFHLFLFFLPCCMALLTGLLSRLFTRFSSRLCGCSSGGFLGCSLCWIHSRHFSSPFLILIFNSLLTLC